MNITINELNEKNVEIGDVINYNGYPCLVIECLFDMEFPIKLVRLEESNIINGYANLKLLNESDQLRSIIAKNHKVKMELN